jgi:hypothetical protein
MAGQLKKRKEKKRKKERRSFGHPKSAIEGLAAEPPLKTNAIFIYLFIYLFIFGP